MQTLKGITAAGMIMLSVLAGDDHGANREHFSDVEIAVTAQ